MTEVEKLKAIAGELRQLGSVLQSTNSIRGRQTVTCARRLESLIPEIEAEIAALKEPMKCGHPKACWQESEGYLCATSKPPHCTACEHERLTVTAALRQAAELASAEPRVWDVDAPSPQQRICAKILSLIPPADRSALDAYVQEKVDHRNELLFRCIKELDYVQSAEHISQCASAEGKELIGLGMGLLGLNDLSAESWKEAAANRAKVEGGKNG